MNSRSNCLTVVGLAVLVGACAAGGHAGYTQTRPDATPWPEARALCWRESMGSGGSGQDYTNRQWVVYNACMARNGWADMRSLF